MPPASVAKLTNDEQTDALESLIFGAGKHPVIELQCFFKINQIACDITSVRYDVADVAFNFTMNDLSPHHWLCLEFPSMYLDVFFTGLLFIGSRHGSKHSYCHPYEQ